MDRAARQHRRQAKAARRRKRIARGERRHSPMRGMQLAARNVQAGHNLENLAAMCGAQRSTLRIFRIRKPVLKHIPASLVLEQSLIADLLSGGKL